VSSYFARCFGFAAPTLGFVVAAHLNRAQGWGEALDGVVSGVFFVIPFAALTLLRARFTTGGGPGRSPLHELSLGALAAVISWCGLWLAWALPWMQPFRAQALAINAATMALAGLVLAPVRTGAGGLRLPAEVTPPLA
jgi:hypothetical protein